MEAQIAHLSLADAAGFRRFLEENRVKLRRMEPCLESPFRLARHFQRAASQDAADAAAASVNRHLSEAVLS